MTHKFTLSHELDAAALSRPVSATFIKDDRDLQYGTALDMINQSCGLFRHLGVQPGDRVAVITQSKVAISLLYIAGLRYGACMVILDPNASPSELVVLLEHSRVAAVFADISVISSTAGLTEKDKLTVIPIKEESKRSLIGLLLIKTDNDIPESYPGILKNIKIDKIMPLISDDQPGVILFTSGSTSTPKGVVLSRGALAAQMKIFKLRFGLNERSRVLNHLPMYHTDGLNQGPLMMWMSGGMLILPPPVNTQTVGLMLDMVLKEEATQLITVPTVLAMMSRLDKSYDDSFSSKQFKFIESTAGPISTSSWSETETRFNVRVVNCYGLTETVSEAFYCGPDDNAYKRGTIGKPDGFEARIVDVNGREIPNGPGELQLRGPGLFIGYFNNPDATNDAFSEGGWFKTGDLAVRDAEGYYSIVGRLKNIIIRASVNIYPDDLNHVISRHPNVRDVATYGELDEALGERVVTCVTTDRLDKEEFRLELFRYINQEIAPEKKPNDIFIIETMPYGPSGKPEIKKLEEIINRRKPNDELKSHSEIVFMVAAECFRTSEHVLAEKDGPETITGWDSLAFLQFIVAVERRFNLKIPPYEVMNIKNLGDVIKIVDRG